MRFDELYLASTGTWLPPRMELAEAERRGLCERRAVWATGVTSVCVSQSESGPEMAVRAAREALARADAVPEVRLVLHASTYFQGHDLWPVASFVQRETVGNRCPAFEVRQMSNGGLAALELAAGHLTAGRGHGSALVTTGDRFALPGYDRWRSDPGTVCGDGGTAAVLTTTGGFARIRAVVTIADHGMERIARGDDPFADEPFARRKPIDLSVTRAAYVRDAGLDSVLERIDEGQRDAVRLAVEEAGADLAGMDWIVLPNLGKGRLKAHFFDPLAIDPERTTWSWGSGAGHLGAGDQFAGLDHLAACDALRPGQRVLLAGVGAGFTWSVVVLEILERPRVR
ncbi:ketoacyl-ACP synthase III family protein [Prauserella shujinwangii]|uniref:ketoacyl-ACP synthase III family protein n=1 Tax=Prauserella shujinwangii TaxID=1453103 RepID=UPI0015E5DCD7|nr:ketoacyl-ACP synthase III family protein [Prauserella shujinwangii]